MSDKRARLLHAFKTHQHLLIARSGLAVPTQEMPMEQILEQILIQFRGHAAKFNFSGSLANLQPNVIYRRTKRLHPEEDIDEKEDLHSGLSLWRKWLDIKSYLRNTMSSAWMKLLGPDGGLPSGKNMDDMLLALRGDCFYALEAHNMANSKKKGGYQQKQFSTNLDWYPLEWEIFLQYGMCSDQPERVFFFE
jgi:hypothetical protein